MDVSNLVRARIDQLTNKDNWPNWKFQMKLLLRTHGYYEIVSGDCMKPVQPTDSGDQTCEQKYRKELKAYEKLEAQAMFDIATGLYSKLGQLVSSCEFAFQMWKTLQDIYEQSSGQCLNFCLERFFGEHVEEASESIAGHVSRMQQAYMELQE